MAGFRKAKPEQAFLKVAVYGPQGSGKTFTTLLCAEGLAKVTGKRVAFVDTEHGTDFYAQDVATRKVHPQAFDFDAIYTRSITDVDSEVRKLDLTQHGVIVLDSMTHLWEAAIAAYRGNKTRVGSIPMHAWGNIKRPYKALVEYLINAPVHVFILGREGNVFEEDSESGEIKAVGKKMKAEGETPYEPHICLHMTPRRQVDGSTIYECYAEKDRSGVLSGRTIVAPNFDNLVKPLLPYLGVKQAHVQTTEEASEADAERIAQDAAAKAKASAEHARKLRASFDLCQTPDEVTALAKTITPELKRGMVDTDVAAVRQSFLAADARVKGLPPPEAPKSEAADGENE